MSTGVHVPAIAAYLAFAIADSCIKAVGGRLGIFEIAFAMNVVAVAVIVPALRNGGGGWRHFWKTPQPLRVHGRALCGLVTGLCSVYAFSTIPLKDVYALFFLAPLFVTAMSVVLLGETAGAWRWTAVAIGFAGVLLALRPGFREIEAGHLAAAVSGLATGISIVIMRSLDPQVRRSSVLGMLFAYSLATSFALMMVFGFTLPRGSEVPLLLLGGAGIGVGQVALLAATRNGHANRVAPFAYTQLLWGLLIGAAVFGEYPDLAGIAGMACIVGAGLLTVLRDRLRQQARGGASLYTQ